MIRIVGTRSGMKGLVVDELNSDEVKNLDEFVSCGEPVILCDDLRDLTRFGIDPTYVEMLA